MIGWYVHSQGLGHLHRLRCIAPHLRTPVTVLSSLARPADWQGEWVELAEDLPHGGDPDPTASGTLHWAPRHHPGLRDRGTQVAAWVARAQPSLVVVDVSVEVAVLVRTLGVPVVLAAMRGDRQDRPHRTAYDLAEALLAPWPDSLPEPWPQKWTEKCWHVGGLSRLDGRSASPPPGSRRVVLLWGRGGTEVTVADVRVAAEQTPGWTWDVVGLPGAPWVDDPWPLLQAADVLVTHAGQNAVAEIAAARRPAVVVSQARPHGEQLATGKALAAGGLALVEQAWPTTGWAARLERARDLDGSRWQQWSDGQGAQRAAQLLDDAAVRLTPR